MASRAFGSTVPGFDGFHVGHFQHLSDQGLACLAVVFAVAEMSGIWPSQLSGVQVALLEKIPEDFAP